MGESFVGVEHGRLEPLFGTDDVVRHVVAIRPHDRRPDRDGYSARREAEVVHHHFMAAGCLHVRFERHVGDRNRMIDAME